MVDVTDISGIGATKAETLAEHGFESVEEIATADPDELAEVKGVGENRALEYIVGAENLLDEVEEESEEEQSGEEFDLTPADLSEEQDDEVEEDPYFELHLEFENRHQYDTFHAALMRHHERHFTGSQPIADAMEKCLANLDSFEEVTYQLDEYELNTLHSAVTQMTTHYQGDNLISHMDELNEVEKQVDEYRDEALF